MKHVSGENQTPQSLDCQAVRFSKLLHVRLNEFSVSYWCLSVCQCTQSLCSLMNQHKCPDDNVRIAETYKVSGCIYFVKKGVSCHVVTSNVWEK
jgi:hypothetical protein